jgi:hypothetical protein
MKNSKKTEGGAGADTSMNDYNNVNTSLDDY